MNRATKTRLAIAVGMAVAATAAYAATQTQLSFSTPQVLSQNDLAYKSKINRMGNGVLIAVYGDAISGAQTVYDVKSQTERLARDIFVRTCPSLTKDCNNPANWSAPHNISNSAALTSISTDWKGTGSSMPYYGDVGKPNIKNAGPAAVITWTSHYCPDGDLTTAGIQAPVQRAVKYILRDNRIIPFSCTWVSQTVNNGTTWSPAQQLSTGERDAAQDSNVGSYNSTSAKGNWTISWQEDPQGLQLGSAEGPGDGASGALVSHGTDVWYTYAADFTTAAGMTWAATTRLTDNQTKMGTGGSVVYVYDGTNSPVADSSIEAGVAGASRPNIGLVGSTTVVAYEETKASQELDSGKYIRFHTFAFNTPPTNDVGCIISNPSKNARRVRFVYQSTTNTMPLAIFWKEGAYDKGGPSDIVSRHIIGSDVSFPHLVPAVDANCATGTSDYATAQALTNQAADNLSANTPTATQANLTDDTEANWSENALAHRGLIRGDDLWVGYSYTSDLGALQYAQTNNYNFWLRHYNVNTGWDNPQKVTNITDTTINVREPRLVGTQGSSSSACPSGVPTDPNDTSLCQNADVFYVAWGTQTNVSPWNPDGPKDLGLYITRTTNSGQTFEPVVQLSAAQGASIDEDSAFESQINVRPDGNMAFAVWNQTNQSTGATTAMFSTGTVVTVNVPDTTTTTTSSSGGGGAVGPWQLLALGLFSLLGYRRRKTLR